MMTYEIALILVFFALLLGLLGDYSIRKNKEYEKMVKVKEKKAADIKPMCNCPIFLIRGEAANFKIQGNYFIPTKCPVHDKKEKK